MSAERVFAGTYITEVEVRDRALAWAPEVMRFSETLASVDADEETGSDNEAPDVTEGIGEEHEPRREMAA
jgi:ParB family chromosome partitioning protein